MLAYCPPPPSTSHNCFCDACSHADENFRVNSLPHSCRTCANCKPPLRSRDVRQEPEAARAARRGPHCSPCAPVAPPATTPHWANRSVRAILRASFSGPVRAVEPFRRPVPLSHLRLSKSFNACFPPAHVNEQRFTNVIRILFVFSRRRCRRCSLPNFRKQHAVSGWCTLPSSVVLGGNCVLPPPVTPPRRQPHGPHGCFIRCRTPRQVHDRLVRRPGAHALNARCLGQVESSSHLAFRYLCSCCLWPPRLPRRDTDPPAPPPLQLSQQVTRSHNLCPAAPALPPLIPHRPFSTTKLK